MSVTAADIAKKNKGTRKQAGKPGPSPAALSSNDRLVSLQRALGNQSVLRLLRSEAPQAKLTVSRPDDIYEQEADRVADQVMRMPEPVVQAKPGCSACGDEEQMQRKPVMTTPVGRHLNPGDEDALQTAATEDAAAGEGRIDALQGGGTFLPDATRKYFEPRFGSDFGAVRVHNDAGANALARSVSARAFTVGRDIVFNAGEYNPGTVSGDRLLAHELTHVVQQQGCERRPGAGLRLQRSKDPCGSPDFPGKLGLGVDGRTWYPHDYLGPLFAEEKPDVATASAAGYNVPRSESSQYNCMGWAIGHGSDTSSWQQGVARNQDHPWPEEELLASKGCKGVKAGDKANHKVKLYEYKAEDQFHIVRQEADGRWSSKIGRGSLWRGINDPDAHTTAQYAKGMDELRVSYWSCS